MFDLKQLGKLRWWLALTNYALVLWTNISTWVLVK